MAASAAGGGSCGGSPLAAAPGIVVEAPQGAEEAAEAEGEPGAALVEGDGTGPACGDGVSEASTQLSLGAQTPCSQGPQPTAESPDPEIPVADLAGVAQPGQRDTEGLSQPVAASRSLGPQPEEVTPALAAAAPPAVERGDAERAALMKETPEAAGEEAAAELSNQAATGEAALAEAESAEAQSAPKVQEQLKSTPEAAAEASEAAAEAEASNPNPNPNPTPNANPDPNRGRGRTSRHRLTTTGKTGKWQQHIARPAPQW